MQRRVEIERKYLLNRLPSIPAGAEVWRIEQGYLRDLSRVRRIVSEDGTIICTRTLKTGSGITRQENERTISIEDFEQLWPQTQGARLRKTRYRVHHGDAIWEIDSFEDVELTLAEIELNAADAPVQFPTWLRPHVVRELTHDPDFTNAAIARRINHGMN